jgi:hypothetical protein
MNKYLLFIICMVPGWLFASQYVLSSTTYLRFESVVEDPRTTVIVEAKIDPANSRVLSSVVVEYSDISITLPNEILSLASNPLIHSLELAYCGQTITEKTIHPCLVLMLDYGDMDQETGEYSSLSVEIYKGKISGYSTFKVKDGVVSEEFFEINA